MVEKEIKSSDKRMGYKYNIAPITIVLIGFIYFGVQQYGYMEAQFLNTYIDHVLNLPYIFIGIMVACSATMGLIFLFVWGIISDNTRSKFGRRRPFILIGGVVCGISFIIFGFSPNYAMVFIIDVIIIGIASNALYAAQRVLVPDQVDIEHRGRVNGIKNYFGLIGILLPTILLFVVKASFSVDNPDPLETGTILTQEGHQILLSIGGIIVIVCSIIVFVLYKDNVSNSELPPPKKFMEEFRETFNIEELKKHREFFKLIVAQTVLMSGVSAVMPYLFNFIFSLEIQATDMAIIFLIAGPVLIVTIYALGTLTDKIGRKKVVIPTVIVSSIGFIMIPFLTQFGQVNSILLGISFALILVGILGAMVPLETWSQDLLPEGRKGQFIGIFNIVSTVSQIIGALTAGVVATLLTGRVTNPIAWIFLVTPFFFVASIIFYRRVEETLQVK